MMAEVLGFLAVMATFTAALSLLTTIITVRQHRPRGFDTIEGIPAPVVTPPPVFHSRYCANRHGAPCDCKGPHA
jgi:hypothetical protein